ncbi:LapA family protein [Bacillus sp. SG-1]|uniref:LapA family protein n=1 Tax=Bacillus sp. SG-1 TaxID=161544 RepID=UPI000154546C|nr:lipopolysaccharide assembly protein LapA domain-containing protein [Bacillus sp. SG-1]EDL62614.1 YrvD [Bacillus sp. SG-1]
MKFQWNLILGLIFALIVAIFAVINVDPVRVNYLFGEAEWPLILVIIGSVLMGGLIVGSVGLFRLFVVQRKVKALQKENERLTKEAEGIETTGKTSPPVPAASDNVKEENNTGI